MSQHRLYPRHITPAGRIIRMGDRYINAQGIELRVARIFSHAGDAEVWVELLPLELPLAGTCWQGEPMMYCANADARISAGEASARPCVYIEDMDSMQSVDTQTAAAA